MNKQIGIIAYSVENAVCDVLIFVRILLQIVPVKTSVASGHIR